MKKLTTCDYISIVLCVFIISISVHIVRMDFPIDTLPPCHSEIYDVDEDGDIDLRDFAVFGPVFSRRAERR